MTDALVIDAQGLDRLSRNARADPATGKKTKAAAADGRYNIPRGDPAYAPKLDHDNDGIACEST